MPTLFSSINVALQAVLAHQQSIEVIEHNVANANTEGYRRQEAVLRQTVSRDMPGLIRDTLAGKIGNGVHVQEIRRFSVDFIDNRYRRETAETGKWNLYTTVLQEIESTLSETSADGLIPKLDAFWDGWRSLAADPTNSALRVELTDRAQDLARGFQRRAIQLQEMQRDQNAAIEQRVSEINEDARQVATLNSEISRILSVGQQPNDLLDERDRLLDRLSELAGTQTSVEDNGEVMVSIAGHALVVGHTSFGLHIEPDPGNPVLMDVVWDDTRPFNSTTGELNGLLDIRNTVIPGLMADLDTLAGALIARVNTVHSAGYALDGATTGLDFFTGTDAMTIGVDAGIVANPDLIAAAETAGAPGDGNNSVTLGRVADELLLTGMPPTQTLNQFYTSRITSFGVTLARSEQTAKDRELVSESLNQQRNSISGVSLDEEAAKLMQSQRAYQAAARVLTTIDEMIDKVINGMGLAGR